MRNRESWPMTHVAVEFVKVVWCMVLQGLLFKHNGIYLIGILKKIDTENVHSFLLDIYPLHDFNTYTCKKWNEKLICCWNK